MAKTKPTTKKPELVEELFYSYALQIEGKQEEIKNLNAEKKKDIADLVEEILNQNQPRRVRCFLEAIDSEGTQVITGLLYNFAEWSGAVLLARTARKKQGEEKNSLPDKPKLVEISLERVEASVIAWDNKKRLKYFFQTVNAILPNEVEINGFVSQSKVKLWLVRRETSKKK